MIILLARMIANGAIILDPPPLNTSLPGIFLSSPGQEQKISGGRVGLQTVACTVARARATVRAPAQA